MYSKLLFAFVLFALIGVDLNANFSRAADVIGVVQAQPTSGRFVKTEQGYMIPYKSKIPGTDVTFEMQPIPGGKFQIGSPAGEANRKPDEGPQVEIDIAPFWMGTYEVTWSEYKTYMGMHDVFKKFVTNNLRKISKDNEFSVVTAPSNLYDPTFTFQFGEEPRQPALSMSQYAAKQYTKWLSGLTGEFYRLPTEAEWEYACRAGTTTAFYFGDNADQLAEHAWFADNSEEKTQLVGSKKPNPWGLFDIYGNVAEWVLDAHTADGYQRLQGKTTKSTDAVAWPTKRFPRVIRGGGWDDAAENCRSAARGQSSDDDWRGTDPNVPKSPWWFTDDHGLAVGIRVTRPLATPTPAERTKAWEADVPDIVEDVNQRIDNEGRGARGVADKDLPAAVIELKKMRNR